MRRDNPLLTFLGWMLLASSAQPLMVVVIGSRLGQVLSEGKMTSLALFILPPIVLTVIGAIALIANRLEGAFAIYLAYLLIGFGGMNMTFIPFAAKLVPKGPYSGDYSLLINSVIVAGLALVHWRSLNVESERLAKIHRSLILGLVLLGAVAHAYGRMQIQHLDGLAELKQLPLGEIVTPLNSEVPVEHRAVIQKNQSITAVFSGKTSEQNLLELVESQELKPLEYSDKLLDKNLPLAKSWKLDTGRFPQEFSKEDRFYIGRLKKHPKMVIQIAWRKSDRQFTAMLMGTL